MDRNNKVIKIICLPLDIVRPLARREVEKIDTVVLHHAACSGFSIETINSMHIDRGFNCIGYHYYIRKNGDIFQGRPLKTIGAHCKGHNATSVGICLEGDFRYQEPTDEQLGSLLMLFKELRRCVGHKLDIKLHRDLTKTLCPARDLIKDLIYFKSQDKDGE